MPCSLIVLIPGCLWDISRPHCLPHVTSWPAWDTSQPRVLCCDHLRCAGATLAHCAYKRGREAVWVDGHKSPAQGPAWHAQPVRGQPRGCPASPEHLPCDSRSQGLATPVPLTAVFICQQEAGRKDTRAGRGEKEEETRAGRAGKEEQRKEREGEVKRLHLAVKCRAADNHRARGFQCPPQPPPALCPAAWRS